MQQHSYYKFKDKSMCEMHNKDCFKLFAPTPTKYHIFSTKNVGTHPCGI